MAAPEASGSASASAPASDAPREDRGRLRSLRRNDKGVGAGLHAKLKRQAMVYEVKEPRSSMPLLHRMWMTFEVPSFSPLAYWYAQFSLVIITLSTVTFCLETEINCHPFSVEEHAFVTTENCASWEQTWSICEIVAVACFSIELVLRFVSCPSKPTFLVGMMNWVDFVAVLPFYVEVSFSAGGGDLDSGSGEEEGASLGIFSVFRVIRLVRVFRVFKMGKSSSGMKMMAATMAESAKVLFVLVFMVGIVTVVFSSAVFSFEQTGAYAADFQSIPRTFWWALVTMTTVGYGDVSPITPMGRFIAVFTMFSGIIIVALPITVIGANFEKQFEKQFFSDQLIAVVSNDDGTVDYSKLMTLMRTLELRGNLTVPLPPDEAALERLVAQYDTQHKGRLDNDDWACLIMDTMCAAHEFTGETINKLVVDVDKLRTEVGGMRERIAAYREHSDGQYEELRALLCGEPLPERPRNLGETLNAAVSPRAETDAAQQQGAAPAPLAAEPTAAPPAGSNAASFRSEGTPVPAPARAASPGAALRA